MIRKAFVIHVKEGKLAEYIKHHNPIWAELEEVLKLHGISNYTIFHRPGTRQLLGYMEVKDEAMFLRLAEQEVCKRWWKLMTSFLESDTESSDKANEEMLTEIFHLK